MQPFWMVYVEDSGGAVHKYSILEEAITEVERLVQKTGKRAYILETTDICEPVGGVVWVHLRDVRQAPDATPAPWLVPNATEGDAAMVETSLRDTMGPQPPPAGRCEYRLGNAEVQGG